MKTTTNFFNLIIFLALFAFINTTFAENTSKNCSDLLNKKFAKLQDDSPQNLCDFQGKVLLVVNTASFCGFTKQYKGLENIYKKYKDKGFEVLGFPSNDFGNQEPGSNKEIADFCENTYGVKFPMFAKSEVKGKNANPLFKNLANKSEEPSWNFHKYLITRDGVFYKSFSSFTSPNSRKMMIEIEKLLSSTQT